MPKNKTYVTTLNFNLERNFSNLLSAFSMCSYVSRFPSLLTLIRSDLRQIGSILKDTGMKLDLDVVAKEKRRVRGPIVTGCSPQWNFYPPIKFRRSFFVWLRSTSERGAGERARCTRGRRRGQFLHGQRQSDFVPSCCLPYCGRSVRLVCLGKKQRIKKLKLSLLQVLCESLDLQAPIPPVRKKAPYVSLLQGLVESCNRSTM